VRLAFLALITVLAVVAARVLPFVGFDPLGDAIESAYRSGTLGLVVGIVILSAAALIAWAVHSVEPQTWTWISGVVSLLKAW